MTSALMTCLLSHPYAHYATVGAISCGGCHRERAKTHFIFQSCRRVFAAPRQRALGARSGCITTISLCVRRWEGLSPGGNHSRNSPCACPHIEIHRSYNRNCNCILVVPIGRLYPWLGQDRDRTFLQSSMHPANGCIQRHGDASCKLNRPLARSRTPYSCPHGHIQRLPHRYHGTQSDVRGPCPRLSLRATSQYSYIFQTKHRILTW